MDFLYFMLDCVAAVWRFLMKPFYQSLVLTYITMFVLGCQVTLWCGKIDGVWISPVTSILLGLFLAKNIAVLVKEGRGVTVQGGA